MFPKSFRRTKRRSRAIGDPELRFEFAAFGIEKAPSAIAPISRLFPETRQPRSQNPAGLSRKPVCECSRSGSCPAYMRIRIYSQGIKVCAVPLPTCGIPKGMTALARKIREARRKLGLKQGELAEALGVTQGTVSRWETGGQTPDYVVLMRLAILAGIEFRDLASEEEHPFGKSEFAKEHAVVAAIAQGVWLERPEWDDDQKFMMRIPIPERWQKLSFKGYMIDDNSAEPYYHAGSVVFAIPVQEGMQPEHGNEVIVVRQNSDNLSEILIMEYYVNHQGRVYLTSLAEDPESQISLKVQPEIPDGVWESTPVVPRSAITGIVIASFALKADAIPKEPI